MFKKPELEEFYNAPQKHLWSIHRDSLEKHYLGQWVECHNLDSYQQIKPQEHIAILGFACDEGVKRNHGRQGAALGPKMIRECLAKIPASKKHTAKKIIDVGDVLCEQNQLELAQNRLAAVVETTLHHKAFPIVLGGGHETAWGHWLGLANAWPHKDIAILNFDAHFDMRHTQIDGKGTSGTPFMQVANFCENRKRPFSYYCYGIDKFSNHQQLFEAAKAWSVNYLTLDDILTTSQNESFIEQVLSHDAVYITLCMDVFSSSVAPGVSAPSALGLLPHHVLPLLKQCAQSGKIVAFDIVECAPPLDTDNRTAKLAAYCIAELLDAL